ncbi:CD9 antigen-like [Mytilus californianus]|uniref:CD9 antigen-like n=1 Tax=Mytilus californianus TaxID=6549 RepID=UPI00224796C4|nr:CD9 antigen-like [Mytilus californianus]
MPLGSCHTCIKYLMFGFNFLFWLLGCAMLGVGIWILVDDEFDKYTDGVDEFSLLYTAAYVVIVVGIIIMVIGFLGCCGAIRENQIMLVLFFACLFIIFCALLGIGIYMIVAKDGFRNVVSEVLKKKVKDTCDGNEDATNFMQVIQENFKCCGADGLTDYAPTSCAHPMICEAIFDTKGCTTIFSEWIKKNFVVVAGVLFGIALILILGMVFAMILCCAVRDIHA